MFEVQVLGVQNFMGIKIPVVEGGFGDSKKSITDKSISEIHNTQNYKIRERINDNIKRFKEGVDIIDLKGILDTDTLINLGYSKQSITQAKHIYLLSERGYTKLIKIMDTDLAWEIHDKLMDEYFTMRQQIKQQVITADQIKQMIDEALKEAVAPIIDRLEKLTAPKEAPKETPKTRANNFKKLPTVKNIAKSFGMTGAEGNKILEEHGIIRRSYNGKGSILNEEYEDRWGTTIYEDGMDPYVKYFELGVNSVTEIFSREINANGQEQLNLFKKRGC